MSAAETPVRATRAGDAMPRGSPAWAPALFVLVLIAVATILIGSLPTVPYHPESDDGYYLRYMSAVAERGPAAFPNLAADYVAAPSNFNYPPPSRVGYIAVTALWARCFGASLPALAHMSIAAHLAFVVVTYLFARRFFSDPRALWISSSAAFSPVLLGMGRQALMDSFILLCSALAIWSFLAVVDRPERKRGWILFGLAFAFAILVKEMTALLALPFLAFVAVERWWRKRPLNLLSFAVLLAVPGIVCVPVLALAAGGLEPLVAIFRGILAGPATNPYTLAMGSGPWYRYVLDFLLLSHGPTLCAIGFLGVLALRLRRGDYDRNHVYFAILAVLLLVEHSFVTKNLRYLMVLELPLRIFAVALLAEVCASASPARTALCVSLAVAAFAWLDWKSFDEIFVRGRAYDPVSYHLLALREIVPAR